MNSEECRNGKGHGGGEHQLQADEIDEYARRRVVDQAKCMIRSRRKSAHRIRQHVRDCLYRPVEVGLIFRFTSSKRPKCRCECRRQVFQAANAPILDDLDLVVPHEIPRKRICKHRHREHDDCGYVHGIHRFGGPRPSVSLLTLLFVSHADSEYTPPNWEPRLSKDAQS